MKKLFLILTAVALTLAGMCQGKSKGKGQSKSKTTTGFQTQEKQRQTGGQYQQKIWAGTKEANGGKGPLPSKNQPARVREAFYSDYPGATNVVWSKYGGDWTASFGSGLFGTRTAIYHANGQRRDTRSVINNNQLPGGLSVWDRIFKRDGITAAGEVVQVERPGMIDRIFRVGSIGNTAVSYFFYTATGNRVQYNY